MKIVYIYYS